MANSVDPDETAHHESSHLVLHLLQRCMFLFARFKDLSNNTL